MKKQNLGPNQKRWLRALRSRKYHQVPGQLGVKDGPMEAFCCLGLGCQLFVSPRSLLWLNDGLNVRTNEGMKSANAPRALIQALGLFSNEGHPRPGARDEKDERLDSLVHLNDEERLSFEQIADIVERYPDAYFRSPR